MKKFSSVLAIVLSLMMVFCAVPMAMIGASAEGEDYYLLYSGEDLPKDSAGAIIYPNSGFSASVCKAVLDNGLKTADGNWYKYTFFDNPGWCNWAIASVPLNTSVMGDSVTDIAAYAMYVDTSELGAVEGQLRFIFSLYGEDMGRTEAGGENACFKGYVSTTPADWTGQSIASFTYADRKAYFVSAVDGSVTAATTVNDDRGGITFPKDFKGYFVVETENTETLNFVDAKCLALTRSYVGDLDLGGGIKQDDTNIVTKSLYVDSTYAIRNLDQFLADASNGTLGMMVGSDDIITNDIDNTTVSWTAVEGAASYDVKFYDSGYKGYENVSGITATSVSYEDAMLIPGDTFYAQVFAKDAEGKIISISAPKKIETVPIPDYFLVNDGTTANYKTSQDMANNTEINAPVENSNAPGHKAVKHATFVEKEWNGWYGWAAELDQDVFGDNVITNGDGFAIWIDFSQFGATDIWFMRALYEDQVDVSLAQDGSFMMERDSGIYEYNNGYPNKSELGRAGTATLINTQTGEVSQLSMELNTERGGFEIPGGFVGYVLVTPNGAQAATAEYNEIKYISFVRSYGYPENWPAGGSPLENAGKDYWFGSVYAVRNKDTFIADVLSGEATNLSGTVNLNPVIDPDDTTNKTVKFDAVEGAASYAVNLYDATTGAYVGTKTAETTSVGLDVDATSYHVQVIAQNADGSTLKISTCVAPVPPCEHSWIHNDAYENTAATCTEQSTEYWICERCNATKETHERAALDHDWEETGRTAATCTENGVINYRCSRCPETKQDTETLTALGHNWIADQTKTNTDATCCSPSNEYYVCDRATANGTCGATEVRHATPATGEHHWVQDTTKTNTDATCTEASTEYYKCDADPNCTETKVEHATEALGHNMVADQSKTNTDATCCSPSNEYYVCANGCGETEVRHATPATGEHHWVQDTTKTNTDATCTEASTEYYKCDADPNCTETKVEHATEALGHNMVADESKTNTAATCTEASNEYFVCANGCGETEVRHATEALGHDMDEGVVTTPATCAAEGVKTFSCKREGCDYTTTEAIAKIAHSYKDVVTAPTATEKGFTTHTCEVCGDSYVDTYVDALGTDKKDELGGNTDPTGDTAALALMISLLVLSAGSAVVIFARKKKVQ